MRNSRYRAFAISAETGSFARAAEKMNYTISGISQLVNALEKELGFSLLTRGKRGVTPTMDGERILEALRSLLYEEERLEQIIDDINGLEVGTIRIGSFVSTATHWLPPIIKKFRGKYPNIEISLMEGTRRENSERLAQKTIDMAFYSNAEHAGDWIPLADDQMLAVIPKNHAYAGAETFPISEIANNSLIMTSMGRDSEVNDLLHNNGITPQIAFWTLENFSAMAMVEHGMGICIMNELITKRLDFDVVMLPFDKPQTISLGIEVPSLEHAPLAVKKFIDLSVKSLKPSPCDRAPS